MRNIIIDLENSDISKIQLTIAIKFIFSKDAEEEHIMDLRSSNIKCTSYNDANEVVNELFELLRTRYLGNLETSMRRTDFIFDSVQLMYYKCHKVNLNVGVTCWLSKLDKKEKSNNKS